MSIWQDVRFGARMLIKGRWLTVAAATALALGIGLNSMMFTIVNAALLRGLPFDAPDRIVAVSTRDTRGGQFGVSLQDFEDYRAHARSVSDLTLVYCTRTNVSDEDFVPEMVWGHYLSSNFFRVIGRQPRLGRSFTDAEDRLGAAPVVILSSGLWKRRYGGDPAIVGRNIKLSGLVFTVVGVMPEDMTFPCGGELWTPLSQLPPAVRAQQRDVRVYQLMGRLAGGVTLSQARSEFTAIGEQLQRDYPASNKDMRPDIVQYNDLVSQGSIRTLLVSLMAAVGFVLLIACANVANLLLARAAHRTREISVRVSLGATRWRIVRQLLVESVLLAALGGVVGFAASIAGIKWFDAAIASASSGGPSGRPYWLTFTLDPVVFAFLAAICLGTGILFGLAPALHISKSNVNEALKEGGRSGTAGIRTRRWTSALIVFELALTLTLLAGAGLMMRSFLSMYRLDIGVDTSPLVMARITLASREYPTDEARRSFLERLNERLAGIGTIQATTTTTSVPFDGGFSMRLETERRTAPADEQLPIVTMVTIAPRYFDTLGLQLLRGRVFTNADGTAGHETVIINQRFVEMYFPGDDPLGRQIRLKDQLVSLGETGWMTIVGVSPNVRQGFSDRQIADNRPEPIVYLPLRSHPSSARFTYLLVRSRADAASITPLLREEVRMLNPDLPVYDIRPVDDMLAQRRWSQRVFGSMFAFFAIVALVLSAVGLYSITAYSVTQRAQEIGIRMALGAQARQVSWLFTRRAVVQLAIGLPLGLAGAIAIGRVLQSVGFLLRTGSSDPATIVSVVLILTCVSLAACIWPARRAAGVDPAVALRRE